MNMNVIALTIERKVRVWYAYFIYIFFVRAYGIRIESSNCGRGCVYLACWFHISYFKL